MVIINRCRKLEHLARRNFVHIGKVVQYFQRLPCRSEALGNLAQCIITLHGVSGIISRLTHYYSPTIKRFGLKDRAPFLLVGIH